MRRTIGGAFEQGSNNFDALRLLAALAVLVSHSYPLTRHGADPLARWTQGQTDGGSAAVAAFFVISGFLVTRSVLSRDPGQYVRARLLRILPALLVVVVVQTFVIGPVFTTLPWRDYLGDAQTFAGLRNASVFDLRNTLPGVFAANPYPDVVNGSLWTLPVECGVYLVLPVLALLGLLRPPFVGVGAALALVAAFPGAAWLGFSYAAPGPFILWSVPFYPALVCLSSFLMGAAIWAHRDAVPLSGGLAICCLIAMYASIGTISAGFVFHLVFPYLVLYAALARPCTQDLLRPLGDISYGVYLYAFPVQQAVVAWQHGAIGPHRLALLAAPIVLACGVLSCRLVERPALRLKAPRRRSRQVAAKVSAWPTP